jgi:hypothetical protein
MNFMSNFFPGKFFTFSKPYPVDSRYLKYSEKIYIMVLSNVEFKEN